MKKMKRLLSVLLTICMLAVMLPVPALTEADAPVLIVCIRAHKMQPNRRI